jgi:hypothetical protein
MTAILILKIQMAATSILKTTDGGNFNFENNGWRRSRFQKLRTAATSIPKTTDDGNLNSNNF